MEIADRPVHWDVTEHTLRADGPVIAMVTDQVTTPSGESVRRDYVTHPGSVAVIAVDDADRLVLVRQYRHPVGHELWEPPAGLLDTDGESWLAAAQRELAEEAALAADDWSVLVDTFTSPGCSAESLRIYLATGLREAAAPEGFVADGEEAHMEIVRVPRDDVVEAVLAGRVHNPVLVAGTLALEAVRAGRAARPADAGWPTAPAHTRAETAGS